MLMIKVILYYAAIAVIAILVGANNRLENDNNIGSKLIQGEQCEGGICGPPEDYKGGEID